MGFKRRSEVDWMANRLAHQGWLGPEPVLPALGDLFDRAEASTGQVLAAAIALIADLACAGDHQHFVGTGIPADTPAGGLIGAPPYSEARAAVIERAAIAERWLADRSARVRGAAAMLCGVTGSGLAAVRARLASERDPAARFDLLVALGWLGEASPADLEADDALVRCGAAIGAVHAGHTSDAIDEALMVGLELAESATSWVGGRVARHVVDVLRYRGRPALLVEALGRVERMARGKLGAGLVKDAFAAEIESGRVFASAAELSAAQRELVELLCRFEDSGWGYGSDQRYWMEQIGLPQCPPALREFLGRPAVPDNALDRPIALAGETGPLWQRLGAACVEGAVAAEIGKEIAGAVADAESVEVVELGYRTDPPDFWIWNAVAVHSLVARGAAVAPHIDARLERFAASPEPNQHFNYWTYGIRGSKSARFCSRRGSPHVPIALQVAGAALAAEPVGRDLLSPNMTAAWREREGDFDSELAGWVRAALGGD